MSARIVEEVPCFEPRWFVVVERPHSFYVGAQFPHFDTHADAVAWCEVRGLAYVTEYFEP